MREELEIGELHKHILVREEKNHKELLGLYQETQTDNKNNQEMHEYAGRLSKTLEGRLRSYNELKLRADIYQNHLREHEFCEAKLMEAGEVIGNELGYNGHLGGSYGNNWEAVQQYSSHHN
jgi:hypothetical protein